MTRWGSLLAFLFFVGASASARAQEATSAATETEAEAGTEAETEASSRVVTATDSLSLRIPTDLGHDFVLSVGGYVETYFAWSFGEPENGLIAWRGFDNRHATFTLSNVAVRTRFELDRVFAAITLQWGHTPDTYYLAEPADPDPTVPISVGVGPSSSADWRFLQEAYLGWNAPLLDGVLIEGGLFLSPIGMEGLAIREQWNWSRTNLFYGLPFYHTGIRLSTPLGSDLVLHAAVLNGWNSVLDNNDAKSIALWLDYDAGDLAFHVLYFGGIERFDESEGAWRNLFDAWVRWSPIPELTLALHANAGFEPVPESARLPGEDPLAWWVASVGYVRVVPVSWLAITARADFFFDRAPGDRAALRIFWPTTPLMSSQTLTLQWLPEPYLSFFVEYRHDHALGPDDASAIGAPRTEVFPSFFEGNAPVPTSTTQNTVTFGATAGF